MHSLQRYIVCFFLFVSTNALADYEVHYHMHHPIPVAYGGGFCHQAAVHTHTYAPVHLEYYNVDSNVYFFIGDPTWYGHDDYEYEEWVSYEYHHPVPVIWGGGYCYIWGPHYHWWAPHTTVHRHYVVTNGRYVYRGPWGKGYTAKKRIEAPRPRPPVRPRAQSQQRNPQKKASRAKSPRASRGSSSMRIPPVKAEGLRNYHKRKAAEKSTRRTPSARDNRAVRTRSAPTYKRPNNRAPATKRPSAWKRRSPTRARRTPRIRRPAPSPRRR